MRDFITIDKNVQAEIVEKKSKFIANLLKVQSQEEAENIIKEIKKKYHDARHNCIAYRVMEGEIIVEKSSDDGEPSGTAGAPMLNILQKNNLVNVVVVVTRYFGGILLGTGGLSRAYSEALQKAIEQSDIIEKCIGYEVEVILDYNNFEIFKYYCKNNSINIVNVEYLENIICRIELDMKTKQKLEEDFETKKLNLLKINDFCKKIITKCK
jgi:uncharacterized YigZ family protein